MLEKVAPTPPGLSKQSNVAATSAPSGSKRPAPPPVIDPSATYKTNTTVVCPDAQLLSAALRQPAAQCSS